jgi:hypothetical protein
MSRHLIDPHGPRAPRGEGKRKLVAALVEDLAADWLKNGPDALRMMRQRDVAGYCRLAYDRLPKDVLIQVENRSLPGGLEPEDWAALRRVLDLIRAATPPGVEASPQEVFAVIEDALRAHFAKQIDGGDS